MIVSCAVTGSVHTPSMSPYLPVTPEQIAAAAIDAAQAGAAVLHLHARDPRTGWPTGDPAVFKDFVGPIREATDAIINITTGGSSAMPLDERVAAALALRPELASLNMGSMNFVFSGAARRVGNWIHDWERDYVLGSEDRIFTNTFKQIEYIVRELGEGCGTRFEFECYDIGHLYTLSHFAERGLVQPPFFIQGVFGVLGGIGADVPNTDHMIRMADHLFGADYRFSMFGAGRYQMQLANLAVVRGAGVRVGLEDSLFIGPGKLAASNADQVAKVIRMADELNRPVASSAEVREYLALRGAA